MDCDEYNDEDYITKEKMKKSVGSAIKHSFALEFAKINLKKSLQSDRKSQEKSSSSRQSNIIADDSHIKGGKKQRGKGKMKK